MVAHRSARTDGAGPDGAELAGPSSTHGQTSLLAVVAARAKATTGRCSNGILQPLFTTIFWSQQIYLDLFTKIVPFIPDKSVWIVSIHFRAKQNFASGSEPNRVLF